MSYEIIRSWCRKLAQSIANCLRRRRPRPAAEVFPAAGEAFHAGQRCAASLYAAVGELGGCGAKGVKLGNIR